ncbi:MAG: hypothetical protein U9Q74_06465 [Gemmatimonadota bacterium]|nr:hypothetical protein [Gemmatimonadota bacterium]
MIVHVQRESGVAHRTFVFKPWHVRLLRALRHRSTRIVLGAILLSWGYLAVEAVRVPLLTQRIARMERDAARLDTLQATLVQLQARYDQVQAMLSRPATAPAASSRPDSSRR